MSVDTHATVTDDRDLQGVNGKRRAARADTSPNPKIIALVLVPALVLTLAFAASYVGALHEPTPHHLPVAVVGAPSAAAGLDALPSKPLDARAVASRAEALAQIDDRRVYGAFEPAANRLYVASAANRAAAVLLETTIDRAAAAQGRPAARVTDVKPLPASDLNGTSAFYLVIAWVFGGYIGATLMSLVGAPRSRSRALAASRIGALAAYAVIAAVLSVVLLRATTGVFAGHVLSMAAIGALTIFASAVATSGIQAAAGSLGTGIVILLFVIFGNAASGGPFARPLLPGFWRAVGGLLPPGASVDLTRAALYFDGARVAGPLLVLTAWGLVGGAVALALGGRVVAAREAETEAAAGAAL